MTFYDKWFGKGRLLARARTAELQGELEKASELYGEAGAAEDVARVFVLRGEGETDPRVRLRHFSHAAQVAPEGTETNKSARLKRAELLLVLAGDAAVSALARHEITGVAKELEAIGEPLKAAEAYARVGDKEGEARALQAAGDVDRLEFLLATEQHRERVSRSREERLKDIDVMVECGRRREALEALESLAGDEISLRERLAQLRARRVLAPVVRLEAVRDGKGTLERFLIVTGNDVVVGRTEGAIKVPSNAISRRHLQIARENDEPVIRDLGSRNGTQLRGINVTGTLPVGGGIELSLGKEVPIRIAPSTAIEGAIEIDVAGERYHACLGKTRTPVHGLELVTGPDEWIELSANGVHMFAGDVELAARTTLFHGDAISTARRGAPVLRVTGLDR